MSTRASTIFTIAGVTVLSGLLAYAVYFDYKRRNDVEFRKKLRKEKKKAQKDAPAQTPEEGAPSSVPTDELRAALAAIRTEEVPESPEQREKYFMDHVAQGEQLCLRGPMFHLPAALCFYRAIRVYPSPVELIVIYQKTVPLPIFQIVMEMMNLDVQNRVEGYYNTFPSKQLNVSIKNSEPKGDQIRKKILVAEKDFEIGDVIYKEQPVVAALDADLEGKGTHCSHCLRLIQKDMAIKPEADRWQAVYCSKDCQVKSKAHSQNLLFGLDPVLPPEHDNGMSKLTEATRDKAQKAYVDYLKTTGKIGPLLVGRFIARQITIETTRFSPGGQVENDFKDLTDPSNDEYGIGDHMERLRYLEMTAPDEEYTLLKNVLSSAIPGLEQSVTDERYAIQLGKMAYNAIGVCYGGGRDDKPQSTERPEDEERTRTPYGTSRQIGRGLYLVSSYLANSCSPSVRPSFSTGTSELHLIASRPIKKGEELTMSYVDVSQHTDETAEQARRRRRIELARGWRFKCECERCLTEAVADTTSGSESDVEVKDGSKVENTVQRYEEGGYVPLSAGPPGSSAAANQEGPD